MSWQSQKNLASELGLVYSHSLFLNSVLLVRGLPTISDQVLSCCPSKTNKQFYYEMSTDIAFSSWIPHQGSRACWLLKAWTHSHCQPVLSALQFSTSSCSPGCASFGPKSLQSCSTYGPTTPLAFKVVLKTLKIKVWTDPTVLKAGK